jgi:magnesium transporter
MPLIQSLPGATGESQPYAEDIYDELQQVVADLTAIEERCSALLGLNASLASKHLAVVSRRLATVATIFLPISFWWDSGDRTSTSLPAASKKDALRSWFSAWG